MRIFKKKVCKIAATPGGSAPEPHRWPMAAGDSASRPSRCYSQLTDVDLSKCVSIVNLCTLKNNTETNSKCYVSSRALLRLFFTSNFKNNDLGRSERVARWPGPSPIECCLALLELIMKKIRIFRWILTEICRKRVILVTKFQKSPSTGGAPLPTPLNLQF